MSEARKKPDAEIERVLKLGLTEMAPLRRETKDWGLADFDHTENFQAVLADAPETRAIVFSHLKELRNELMRKNEAKAAALRHRDTVALLSTKIDELKRPYWTGTLTFWVALSAMIIAWLAWLYPHAPDRILLQLDSWVKKSAEPRQ
jgi:hypothetical protein